MKGLSILWTTEWANSTASVIPAALKPFLIIWAIGNFLGNLYGYNCCAQKANNEQIDDDNDNEIIVSVEWKNVC